MTNPKSYAYQNLNYTADRVTVRVGFFPVPVSNVPINVDVCLGQQAFRCSSAGNPVPATTAFVDASSNYSLVLDSSVTGQYNEVNGLKIAPGDITVNGLQDVYSKIEIGDTSFQGANIADGGYLIANTDPLIDLVARADGEGRPLGITLNVGANAFIDRVQLDEVPIHLVEDLRYLHDFVLEDDGGFLSLQSESVCWEGSSAANCSQAGYWFEISQPVDIGDLELSNIEVPDQAIRDIVEALIPALEAADHNGSLGNLNNIQVDVNDTVFIGIDAFSAPISQSNLDIFNQVPASNCYGGIDCF